MAVERPRRGSFHWVVYVDLVCFLKMMRKTDAIKATAQERKLGLDEVKRIYARYIAPQLRAGVAKHELV